jgi:hypothetical protein
MPNFDRDFEQNVKTLKWNREGQKNPESHKLELMVQSKIADFRFPIYNLPSAFSS